MKKLKFLPSVLMLVLSIAVLALGVYAANPVSHNVVGTIKVTASNALVNITVYLDDSDGDYTNDVKVSDSYQSRAAGEISIYEDALKFNCDGISDAKSMPTQKMYLLVENKSDFAVGVYFLEGTLVGESAVKANIATTRQLSGTGNEQTIPNVVTADFSPYTKIEQDKAVRMYCMLTLNATYEYEVSVELELDFNVEEYNPELITEAEETNTINFVNKDNMAVKTNCLVETATTKAKTEDEITADLAKTKTMSIWNTSWTESTKPAFSTETYGTGGQLRLQPIKLKMVVNNQDSAPVKVTITKTGNNQPSTIDTSEIDCDYIAPCSSEEISIQFAAIVTDRTTAPTTPTLADYGYTVTIERYSDDVETIYDRIEYDDTSYMAENGFNYYIEYGSYEGKALRWYVWAKDNGAGKAVPLEPSDKVKDPETEANKLAKGNVYYFISEYILDEGNTNGEDYFGMCYQNDINTSSTWMNLDDGKYSSSYAASNIRNYMNGNTVRRQYKLTSGYFMAQGANLNMYNTYNLTSDPLFNQIMGRSVKELYDADSGASESGGLPDAYEDQMDKFWALSEDEYTLMVSPESYAPAIAYQLSTGTTSFAGSWWLRSPDNDYLVSYAPYDGLNISYDVYDYYVGIRPAFKIGI